MRALWIAAALLPAMAGLLGACGSLYARPDVALTLPQKAPERRARETRRFDTTDEVKLLRTSLVLLQDSGYQLAEMDGDLGFFAGFKPGWDHMSVSTQPVASPRQGVDVRVTFQTLTWTLGRLREPVKDPALYQAFFDRLSKAVFLEAHAP